jgi:hypothetical protein
LDRKIGENKMAWKVAVNFIAVNDVPPFTYREAITLSAQDLDALLQKAETALTAQINKINAEADLNTAMQTTVDARPAVAAALNENAKAKMGGMLGSAGFAALAANFVK